MASKTDGIFNLTAPVVATWLQVFEPKAYMRNGKVSGEPKYSATLNFESNHPDIKGMKELAAGLARAKWPTRPLSELAFPFLNGDKLADKRKAKGKDDGDFTRGKIIINAKSRFEPRLAYLDGKKIVEVDSDMAKATAKSKFYPGVKVLAQLNFVPYDDIGEADDPGYKKGGVTAYLNHVLSLGQGERLGGGVRPRADVFKGYAGLVSEEDPLAGEDDLGI